MEGQGGSKLYQEIQELRRVKGRTAWCTCKLSKGKCELAVGEGRTIFAEKFLESSCVAESAHIVVRRLKPCKSFADWQGESSDAVDITLS